MPSSGRSFRVSAIRSLALVLALALSTPAHAPAQQLRLVADSGRFLLDGKPLQIISGEMHYARVPREYWRDRLHKARMMGLNTISTYVFWNLHEPTPGHYDFSGQNDIAAYVKLAQAEGLHVIVRPGPYVCAEWELGGYPAWLFADTAIVLRSTDPHYTQPAERWMKRLGQELAPLMSARGGPIIAVQVENEYGSFDRDKAYMTWQHDLLVRTGFGDALLYTADGDVQLPNGTLPNVPAVVNFGVGGADSAFARLARFRPTGPLMSGEYWAGWFDQWGVAHHTTNVARQVRELTSMLSRGFSINLYMFHGGTTPGFMNGANIDNRHYLPQTSSYDYDAALDESGRPTPKFLAFRDAIATVTHATPIPMQPVDSTIAIPSFPLSQSASLWTELGKPVRVEHPRNMESFGQAYGYILYRTTIPAAHRASLHIKDIRDYARIYLNGTLAGTLDRRLGTDSVAVDIPAGGRLDILVENLGRVNFNKPLRDERKGITTPVILDAAELTGWEVYTLPMSSVPTPGLAARAIDGPAFYAGTFTIAKVGDSFLDTRGWGKGTVWINGHHLGRFWDIGPQQTLYVPGPWLRAGRNEILVFDYDRPASVTMSGLKAPILGQMNAGMSGLAPEAYEVYRAVLTQHYHLDTGQPWNVRSMTGGLPGGNGAEDRNFARIQSQVADTDLVATYFRTYSVAVPIPPQFGLPRTVVLTDSAVTATRAAAQGSGRGSGTWPDIFAFGFPAFNAGHTQALVKVFRSCGLLCGEGGLFLLEKQSAGWVIVQQLYVIMA